MRRLNKYRMKCGDNCVTIRVHNSLYDAIEEVRKDIGKQYNLKIGLAPASKILANKLRKKKK